MDEEKQVPALTYVAVVAPVWLQHALVVFLHSAPELKLIACTATVKVLLELDLSQDPELIILETHKKHEHAQDQIKRLKATWPASSIIALIPHESLAVRMQTAGADEVLVSGAAPQELYLAISRLVQTDNNTPVNRWKNDKD